MLEAVYARNVIGAASVEMMFHSFFPKAFVALATYEHDHAPHYLLQAR